MKFWETLFDTTDHVNVCSDSVKEISSYSIETARQLSPPPKWVCVNPLIPGRTRATKNLKCARNFVVEFDNMDVADQMPYIKRIGLPFSTAVFSGNKSIHFVISLDTDLSVSEYRDIAKMLKHCLPECDAACLEPARLTRCPNKEAGQVQLAHSGKVTLDELREWLDSRFKASGKTRVQPTVRTGSLTMRAARYLSGLSKPEVAHDDSLHAAKNLFELGFEFDRVVDLMVKARRISMAHEPIETSKEKTERIVEWVYDEWESTKV